MARMIDFQEELGETLEHEEDLEQRQAEINLKDDMGASEMRDIWSYPFAIQDIDDF